MILITTKYCTICLIAVVFCTIFLDGFALSRTTAEVNTKLTCTSTWQKLKLNWTCKFADSSLTCNFSSFCGRNEEDFKRQTIERLLQTVIYPRNFTQIVSCYGTVASNNVSYNVTLPKVGSELLGIRFVTRPCLQSQRALEFYLRPEPNISYSLNYCCESCNNDDLLKDYKCPIFREVKFSCLWRDHDVYRISNSDGLICEASTIDYITVYSKYTFNIRSTTPDGFGSVSADFRIFAKQSGSVPITEYAEQGLFTVVLMGQKSKYLAANPTNDLQVVLKWEKTTADSYRVDYNCDNGVNGSKTYKFYKPDKTTTTSTIYDKNFVANSLCRFCVTYLVVVGSLRSEPMCNKTRLPEKPPRTPPVITCDFKTCPTTNHSETRDVTVICEFPEKSTRNGVLNKLRVIYWKGRNNDTKEEVTTNLTLCQVTLNGLNKRSNYHAQISVCNSEGCSGLSNPVLVAASFYEKTQGTTSEKTQGTTSDSNLLWLTLLAFLPIAAIVIAVFVCYLKKTTKDTREQLPGVHEPKSYEELSEQKVDNYDQLPNGNAHENNAHDVDNM